MNKIDAENSLDDVIAAADAYVENPKGTVLYSILYGAAKKATEEDHDAPTLALLESFEKDIGGDWSEERILKWVAYVAATLRTALDEKPLLEELVKAVDGYAKCWSDENRAELENALSDTGEPSLPDWPEAIEFELESMSAVIFMPHGLRIDEREGLEEVVKSAAKIRELLK